MRKPNRWLMDGLAAMPAQRLTREWNAVRRDDPIGRDRIAREANAFGADAVNWRTPQHANARRLRRLHHAGMQNRAANPERISFRKWRGDGNVAIDEADAMKRMGVEAAEV